MKDPTLTFLNLFFKVYGVIIYLQTKYRVGLPDQCTSLTEGQLRGREVQIPRWWKGLEVAARSRVRAPPVGSRAASASWVHATHGRLDSLGAGT